MQIVGGRAHTYQSDSGPNLENDSELKLTEWWDHFSLDLKVTICGFTIVWSLHIDKNSDSNAC